MESRHLEDNIATLEIECKGHYEFTDICSFY